MFNNKLFSNTTVAYNHYQMSMADSYKKEATGTEKKTNTDPMHNETYTYNSDYRSGYTMLVSRQISTIRLPEPSYQIRRLLSESYVPSGGHNLQCERSRKRISSTRYHLIKILLTVICMVMNALCMQKMTST